MTRAIITGVTGCLGSNLAAALVRQGVDVIGIVQPGAPRTAIQGLPLTLREADILDAKALQGALEPADWLFHTAAIADDWKHSAVAVYRTNVAGTENVLAAARWVGVRRFLLTASAAALGVPTRLNPLLDENSRFNLPPQDWTYAYSKVMAEKALWRAAEESAMECVSLLPTAIIGPADQSQISGQLVVRAWQGDLFPFPQGGVNFVDVRDVAAGEILAARHAQPGERYVLGGHNLSHLHVLGVIADELGVPVRYLHLPEWSIPALAQSAAGARRLGLKVPIDAQRVRMSRMYMYYNNAKAVEELGFQARPFSESVRATLDWYLRQGVLTPRPALNCSAAFEGGLNG